MPALHLFRDKTVSASVSYCEPVSEALALYPKLEGVGKDKVFHRWAERNVQSVIEVSGGRPLDEYLSSDAATYRDYLSRAIIHHWRKRIPAIISKTINPTGDTNKGNNLCK